MVALSSVYLIIWGRGEAGSTAIMVAIAICFSFGYSGLRGKFDKRMRYNNANWDVLYRANSNYGELLVIQYRDVHGVRRTYLNDKLTQNTYDPEEKKSRSLFTGALRWLAHAYTPKIEHVLCIGMGVGIVPMQFANAGILTDVVEINGAVVPLAEKYFNFDSSKLTLALGDGRQFLNQYDKRYDAIILDAFLGDSSPSHLMTEEAFIEMRRHLTEHGVLVINSFGESSSDRRFFAASLDKTLRAVFGQNGVRVHASGYGNVFFVAASDGELTVHHPPMPPDVKAAQRLKDAGTDEATIAEWNKWYGAAKGQGPFFSEHAQVQSEMGLMWKKQRTFDLNKGQILRDDFNPVEFHDSRNREDNRRGLVRYLE